MSVVDCCELVAFVLTFYKFAAYYEFVTDILMQYALIFIVYWWWRGTVVERRSLAGELSLSCGRPAANVGKPSAIGQPTRPTRPFILSGSIIE